MFEDFASLLDSSPFAEVPVDVKTFVEGKDYLDQPKLSELQYNLVEAMSQIYREEELKVMHGDVAGRQLYKRWTKREVIMALGKGTNIGSTLAWSPEYGLKEISDKQEDYGLIQSMGCSNGATAFYSEGVDKVFKVTTKLGYSFTGNASHKFYGWKDDKTNMPSYLARKSPTELHIGTSSVGDLAAIYGNWEEPHEPYPVTQEEARLIGYMVGDGTWMREGSRNPMFTNGTPEVQEDFVGIVESLGGELVYGQSGAGCWQVRINKINWWFRKHGLDHEYGQKKPWNNAWSSMSDESLSAMIQGIWATDGWASTQEHLPQRGRSGHTSVTLAVELNSESIIGGIHLALLRLGIKASFRQSRDWRNDDKHSPMWRVSITDSFFVKSFIDKVGYPLGNRDAFAKVYEVAVKKGYQSHKGRDVFYDRIASIEYKGEQEVFACTVESGHNYIGNGFVHGNSGKDHTSTIGVAYVVYKLLCLRNPTEYYGVAPGEAIDIINIAINAQQAKNVFFKGFKNKIRRSPWFEGKYYDKTDSIEFDHAITVYSGHSERESHEGLNLFIAILDEISGFGEGTALTKDGKTAENIYKAFRGTVDSRFAQHGKVVLLSFPRYEDDFISQKYDQAVKTKDVVKREHTFVLNESLPHDRDDNRFTIDWEEDHITGYTTDHTYALKRPTWEVNPIKSIDDFKMAFFTDPSDAKMRFLCTPSVSSDAFFRSKEKIESAMSKRNPVDEHQRIDDAWQPQDDKVYYVHADLAQVHDKCAVAVSHVEKWVQVGEEGGYRQAVPLVVVDMIAWWEPQKTGPVDLSEVKRWIQALKPRGVNLGMVTFDRWHSYDIQKELRDSGIYTETLSVAKKHYEDLAMLVYEDRVILPNIPLLLTEMTELKIVKQNKVDHPRKASKDLSDAMTGSVFNSISRTPRDYNQEIDIHIPGRTPQPREADIGPEPLTEEAATYLGGLGLL